jgi:hypothetical protein
MQVGPFYPIWRVGRITSNGWSNHHIGSAFDQSIEQRSEPCRRRSLVIVDERNERRGRVIETRIARDRDILKRGMNVDTIERKSGSSGLYHVSGGWEGVIVGNDHPNCIPRKEPLFNN